MSFTLTFDLGNTNQSFALFDSKGECVESNKIINLREILNKYQLEKNELKSIISSVKDSAIKDLNLLEFKPLYARSFFQKFQYLEMPVSYSETLGDDRLFSSYFLYKKYSEKTILIDTGTFTTVDIISNKGLEGGYILPGLALLRQSYESGENLIPHIPKVTDLTSPNEETPKDSLSAITKGLLLSYLSPLTEIISKEKPIHLVLTGGNSKILYEVLDKKLCGASIHLENNLLHRSLCFIANNKD